MDPRKLLEVQVIKKKLKKVEKRKLGKTQTDFIL